MLANEYDRPVAEFLARHVAPSQVCFNVGANVGVYVLQLSHFARPTGRVVAFEPNPAALAILRRHVALNGLETSVTVVPEALSDENGTATFYAAGADGMSRLGEANVLLGSRATEFQVKTTTLDSYVERTGLEPDWLVMDIEGFEIRALLGARELLRRRGNRIGVVVELHPSVWPSARTTRELAEGLFAELDVSPVPLTGQTDPLAEHGMVYLHPRSLPA